MLQSNIHGLKPSVTIAHAHTIAHKKNTINSVASTVDIYSPIVLKAGRPRSRGSMIGFWSELSSSFADGHLLLVSSNGGEKEQGF